MSFDPTKNIKIGLKHSLALLTLFFAFSGFSASAQESLAIRAGKIITGVGQEIKDGTILIEQGKIVAIGKEIQLPANVKVQRYPNGVIIPGFVFAHSQAGLRISNENLPVVPYISVMDGIDPISRNFPNLLREGVTTVHVLPGNRTRIGGQGAILRPYGKTVDEMLVKNASAIKISLAPGFGQSPMSHMAAMRNDFLSLYNYLKSLIPVEPGQELPEAGTAVSSLTGLVRPAPKWSAIDYKKIPEGKIDAQRMPFVKLIKKEIPAVIYCSQASDVLKAFEIMDTHGIKARIVMSSSAYKAKDILKKRKDLGPIVISPNLETTEIDPITGKEKKIKIGKVLHDAGIEFAVETVTPSGIFNLSGSYHPWFQVATLIKQGVPKDVALKALTLTAAKAIGLDHRLGSLEKGKDANFVIFSGDMFDVRTWVDHVFIEGREVYARSKDHELQELLKDKEKGN